MKQRTIPRYAGLPAKKIEGLDIRTDREGDAHQSALILVERFSRFLLEIQTSAALRVNCTLAQLNERVVKEAHVLKRPGLLIRLEQLEHLLNNRARDNEEAERIALAIEAALALGSGLVAMQAAPNERKGNRSDDEVMTATNANRSGWHEYALTRIAGVVIATGIPFKKWGKRQVDDLVADLNKAQAADGLPPISSGDPNSAAGAERRRHSIRQLMHDKAALYTAIETEMRGQRGKVNLKATNIRSRSSKR